MKYVGHSAIVCPENVGTCCGNNGMLKIGRCADTRLTGIDFLRRWPRDEWWWRAISPPGEIITDDETGLLFRKGDVAHLATAIVRAADPDLRARIGGAARISSARFDDRALRRRVREPARGPGGQVEVGKIYNW
jgi:hypothetical protein